MKWFKNVLVDVIVTLSIAAAVWLQDGWMWWVITIYALLLLVAKSAVLFSSGMMRRTQAADAAPSWFLHLLYALNVMLVLFAGWWFLAGLWMIIWLLSFIADRQKNVAS